jgi:superfamily II DNA/RNA helicase
MNKFSNYSNQSRGSRSSSGGRGFGGRSNSSFRGGNASFNGKPFRRSGGGPKKSNIMPEMYIAKAVHTEAVSVYETDHKYEDFKLEKALFDNIAERDYIHPTKIQHKAIPHILEGKDILGLASTGSGKTAAFLIPMINKLLKDNTQRCLVVVPTRELAAQVQKELNLFAKQTSIRSVLIIGGENIRLQTTFLKKNPQFVIGTPGRLKDLYNRGNLRLNTFNNVVLDEVDRMLDMGFIDDIKELISKLTEEKQSLFFSATMTKESESIANKLLNNPVKVEIEKQSPLRSVDQDVVKVKTYSEKIDVLHNILIKEEVKKTIVFTATKKESESLSTQLNERGFKTGSIHGDKSQHKRKRVIEMFSKDAITILVATDVAARGIDIPDITHVINFDEPQSYDDYIHRIGRTGRIGKKGSAITFIYDKKTYSR